jgi:thiol:disulfide interchange protein DsbD
MGRSGVPAYALYVPGENNPRLLPEVLTPGIVTDAVAKLPKTAR